MSGTTYVGGVWKHTINDSVVLPFLVIIQHDVIYSYDDVILAPTYVCMLEVDLFYSLPSLCVYVYTYVRICIFSHMYVCM